MSDEPKLTDLNYDGFGFTEQTLNVDISQLPYTPEKYYPTSNEANSSSFSAPKFDLPPQYAGPDNLSFPLQQPQTFSDGSPYQDKTPLLDMTQIKQEDIPFSSFPVDTAPVASNMFPLFMKTEQNPSFSDPNESVQRPTSLPLNRNFTTLENRKNSDPNIFSSPQFNQLQSLTPQSLVAPEQGISPYSTTSYPPVPSPLHSGYQHFNSSNYPLGELNSPNYPLGDFHQLQENLIFQRSTKGKYIAFWSYQEQNLILCARVSLSG